MTNQNVFIEVDPKVMLGKARIKGTRITVETILEKFSSGYTSQEILEMYPHLTTDVILACVSYKGHIIQ